MITVSWCACCGTIFIGGIGYLRDHFIWKTMPLDSRVFYLWHFLSLALPFFFSNSVLFGQWTFQEWFSDFLFFCFPSLIFLFHFLRNVSSNLSFHFRYHTFNSQERFLEFSECFAYHCFLPLWMPSLYLRILMLVLGFKVFFSLQSIFFHYIFLIRKFLKIPGSL